MRTSKLNSLTSATRSKEFFVGNLRLTQFIGLVVIIMILGVSVAQAEAMIGEPCTQCAPGSFWVDSCDAGRDSIDNTGALVDIDLLGDGNLDCIADLDLDFGPCFWPDNLLIIERSAPVGGVINTEIVSMCLKNIGGFILIAGGGLGNGPFSLAASEGQIVQLPLHGDSLAESFFDVFFEIYVPPTYCPPEFPQGMFLYNQKPLRLTDTITCAPPVGDYIHPVGCCTLWTDPNPGFGMPVAALVTAHHQVNTPTLSEWGLIIFSLLILTLITTVVVKRRMAGIGAGTDASLPISGPLFFPALFIRVLTVTIGLSAVILVVATVISGSVPLRDIVGTILSGSIVAYIIHLWLGASNTDK